MSRYLLKAMQNTNASLEELYRKWVNKKASPREEEALFELLSRIDIDNRLTPLMKERWEEHEAIHLTGKEDQSDSRLPEYTEERRLKIVQDILEKYPFGDDNEINVPAPVHRAHFLKTAWLRYAAAILIILSIAFYMWQRSGQENGLASTSTEGIEANAEVVPGGDKAILTLADGSTIILDNAIDGKLAQQGGVTITKSANGGIIYSADPSVLSSAPTYNTMTTPRGGNYRLVLPDGSLVWLNAASSITFPTAFSGAERSVSISGEVYFEVARNEQKPFRVTLDNNTQIEVLGTHFNVNTYKDEASVNTTLLEGSVRIKNEQEERMLRPGQQAQVDGDGKMTLKKEVDIQSVIAWKEDEFHFGEKADFKTVMRQISRWYDVDVEYKGNITGHLGGSISRKADISLVLKMLEKAGGVKFILKEKKLIVMPST